MAKPPSDNPWLDIGPLREWLHQQAAVVGGTRVLAAMVDRDIRQVSKWMNQSGLLWVTLDNVDSIGCAWGDPTLLRQLYPAVYELPEWLDSDEVAA